MARKSSKSIKPKNVAPKPAPTPSPPAPTPTPFHGASTSSASAFSSQFNGGGGSSSLYSTLLSDVLGADRSSISPISPGESRASIGNDRLKWLEQRILELLDYDSREDALAKLAKKRQASEDMAPLIWFSFGTIASLLQEVISVYPFLSPSSLTSEESNRACNVLALLQCVASYSGTRIPFAQALIPYYLHSFLRTTNKSRPFEHLRLSALGVIGALVKVPDTKVICLLLSSEIMPLLLHNMESGVELSRTVATFIVEKILLSDVGLAYVCFLPERLFAVNQALRNVVVSLAEQSSARLLKLVIRCYLRISQDERSLPLLRNTFPKRLIDGTFDYYLREDHTLRMWLQQLLDNIQVPRAIQEGIISHFRPNIAAAYYDRQRVLHTTDGGDRHATIHHTGVKQRTSASAFRRNSATACLRRTQHTEINPLRSVWLKKMSNLPSPLNLKAAPFEVGSGSSSAANKDWKMQSAEQLVLDLCNPDLRENALLELSKKRELFQDLAPLLWNSFGTVAALLQEIVSIYPVLSPPNLTPAQSNRVCNALALLQCVASHPDTRMLFLNAHIPLYLYPFLNTTSKSRPFEYLRLTSLGVIGALVKVDDTEVISFLLSTEIIPLCLRTMEMGSELSKTVEFLQEFCNFNQSSNIAANFSTLQVATFIVQKILLDDVGLEYICTTAERFFAVGRVLGNMVAALAEQPSSRLLKHIIRCYLRLSDNLRACEALRSSLPDMLRDATFSSCLREDPTTRRWLQQLLINVQGPRVPMQAGGGFDHMMVN
ncbi:hypothetical protein BUALT_Bualt03G0113900 [Buddleja alternifolia]|uniref:Cell differentiation protein rcd1 n=1 Tax=Buddleja alternifolia TaxID=168488 RepID=A0AAV6Y456_9LAMI|nr:hypothetical protein BUALT_Bualt03G0113900 [Buddleja alternifolia]